MITVFTPAYNRAYIIGNLYESLCHQTYQDFEWLIVDDGSTDNTREIIEGFIAENRINIRYIHKVNGGKHTATNLGVREAKGELFFIVDSDDKLPEDSLATIMEYYLPIKDNPEFAGVCGVKSLMNGKPINALGFGFDVKDLTQIQMTCHLYPHNVDKAEVFKTAVLREYPFPVFQGEKFVTESLVWNRIGLKFKLRYFNKSVYLCEYLEDGYTKQGRKLRYSAPRASMLATSEWVHLDIALKYKIKSYINFWAYATKPYTGFKMLNPLSLLFYVPGRLLRFVDLHRFRK